MTQKDKFLLIYPPSCERAPEFPVGGLFLADALKEHDCETIILCDKTLKEITDYVRTHVTDNTLAVGLSVVSTLIFRDAIAITKLVKTLYPTMPVVWGGQAVTGQKEDILEFPEIDYVVVGDGEHALPALLDVIRTKTDDVDIEGVGYKDAKGKTFFNGTATIPSLDGVTRLPYEILDVDTYYRSLNIGGDRWLGAIFSRGCPFRCTFCIVSSLGSNLTKMRYHTLDHVINDLKVLTGQYNADAISIHDDHFLVRQTRVQEFCRAVIDEGIKVDFRANGRIDSIARMKEETLVLLRKAGFVNLIAGIETGSPRFLEVMKKQITVDQIAIADKKLAKHGFYKHWNFMTAMPGETMEDVGHTLWMIAQVAKTSMKSPFPISFRKFIPLPGTQMYREAVELYGFEEPASLQEWSDISESYMNERSIGDFGEIDRKMRPWLTPELGRYMQQGEDLVSSMNSIFTGPDSNQEEITNRVLALENLALQTVSGKTEYPKTDFQWT